MEKESMHPCFQISNEAPRSFQIFYCTVASNQTEVAKNMTKIGQKKGSNCTHYFAVETFTFYISKV